MFEGKYPGCDFCDHGIMTLYPQDLKAPCLNCSPTWHMEDLLYLREKRLAQEEKIVDDARIAAHNERIRELGLAT